MRPACPMLTASLLLAASLHAQCVPAWHSLGVPDGVNATVFATVAWDPDGAGPLPTSLVLGGVFYRAGATAAKAVVRLDPDGSFHTIGGGLGLGTVVYSLAVAADGALLAGGYFQVPGPGGATVRNVARFDGTDWQPLGDPDGAVFAIEALPNGDLLLGGDYTTIGGAAISNLARFDGVTWSAVGNPNARVTHLESMPNGDLAVSGWFETIGGQAAGGLALQTAAGWTAPAGPTLFGAGPLLALPNGDLVLGGHFNQVGGVQAASLARWNGVAWSNFEQNGGSGIIVVQDLALDAAGRLVACGDSSLRTVATYDGQQWSGFAGSGSAKTICAFGADLYVGGMTYIEGRKLGNIARWDGSSVHSVNGGLEGSLEAMCELPDGSMLVAGPITGIDDVPVPTGFARFDGVSWHAFGAGPGATGGYYLPSVAALVALPDGTVAAAGAFTSIGGQPIAYAARFDGVAWVPLGNPGEVMLQMHLLPDGELIARSVNGNLLRLQGSAWVPFAAGSPVAYRTAVGADGTLVAVGQLAGGGIGCARWDGSVWQTLGSLPNASWVQDLAVLTNGDVLFLSQVDQSALRRFDGVSWTVVGAGVIAPGSRRIVPLPDGNFALLGRRTLASGGQVGVVARWSNGTLIDLATHDSSAQSVDGLFVTAGGDLVAYRSHGVDLPGFALLARWSTPCPANSSELGAGCVGGGTLVAGTPWVGAALRCRAEGLPPGFALVVTGLAPTSLPLAAVFPTAGAGCTLLVMPDLVEAEFVLGDHIDHSILLLADPALAGIMLHQQVVSFAFAPSLAIAVSNALSLTLGSYE